MIRPHSSLHFDDTRSASLGDVSHTLAKNAVDANNNLVTRFDEIYKTKFHSGAPCPADRKDHRIFGPKHDPKHVFDLIHEFDKSRVKVAHQRI